MTPVRIGLAGFGSVGRTVADRLDSGQLPHAVLTAISARDLAKAEENSRHLRRPPMVVAPEKLPEHADVILECATAEAFPTLARTILQHRGKVMIALSAAGVPAFPDMLALAEAHASRIRVVSGALPGLDSVRCAAEGTIRSVKLNSRIKPETFVGEPFLEDQGYDFSKALDQPVHVFTGTARQAASAFPRHFNVAVSLSLAGVGLDYTAVDVWADPHIPGAIHNIELLGEEIELSMTARNRPSTANPKTSRIIALSALAAIRAITGPIQVGS